MPGLDLLAAGLVTLDIALHPVEAIPPLDAGVLVETIRLSPAGTAGGMALVAARLGLRTAIAGAVGDDLQGVAVREGFLRERIDVSALDISPGLPTSTTVLPVRPGGQRSTQHMIGASMMTPLGDAAWALVEQARAVHWGGVGYPGLADQGPRFLAKAKAHGAFVTCDLISPQPSARGALAELLPHVDLFMPSLAEVRVLTGSDDLAAAAADFIAMGAGGCVFKLGAEGAAMVTPAGEIRTAALPIAPVDTTSCGDSFCAGFHAARRHGLDNAACLDVATATAALVAQGVGTLGALIGYDETLAYLEARRA